MKVVRRGPNKFWIRLGGRIIVLRLEREIQLIPRWRIAGALFLSSVFTGVGFALREPAVALPMLGVALLCLWGAGR